VAVPVAHTALTTDRLENANANGVNTLSITIGNPSNTAVGDLLVVSVVFQNGGGQRVVNASAGWTAVSPTPASSGDAAIRNLWTFVYPIPDSNALTNLPSIHTFSRPDLPGRAAITIFRVTGADLTLPTDGASAWSPSDGTTSSVAPSFTATDNQSLVLIVSNTNNSALSGVPVASSTTATVFANVVGPVGATTQANTTLNMAYVQAVAGTNPAQTLSYSPAATNSGSYQLAIKSAAPSPLAPILLRSIQGLPTASEVRANVRSQNTTEVAINVSANSDMSDPIVGTAVSPDADGYAVVTAAGLSPDTDYYWQVTLDGTPTGDINLTRTLPVSGAPNSHAIIFGSCMHKGASPAAFDDMRTRTFNGSTAAAFLHVGDLAYEWASYQPITTAPNDIPTVRGVYEASLTSTTFNHLVRDIPLAHTWSDNDFCGTNSDSTAAGRPALLAVRHQSICDPANMPSAEGLYKSWVIGRVRYVQTDARTYMAQKSLPDNGSKSMLGTTQKQWFKDELLAAQAADQIVIWSHDQIWLAPTVTPDSTNDTWGTFNTERTEIGNFIASNGLTNRILYVCGDTHTLTADDGTNNPWGGFACATAAPFYQTANAVYGTWSEGGYPDVGSPGLPNQSYYGWLEITDNGENTINVQFRGFDATSGTGIERIGITRTLVARELPTVAVWDSANEIPATVSVWDGANEISSSADVTT